MPLNQVHSKPILLKHVNQLGFHTPLPRFESYQLGQEKLVQKLAINIWVLSITLAENVISQRMSHHQNFLPNVIRVFNMPRVTILKWWRLLNNPAKPNELPQLELPWFGAITGSS